jgi:hypothetical protein
VDTAAILLSNFVRGEKPREDTICRTNGN